MSMPKGTRFGPYEIAALIGVGGMGEVYRATDTNLKRDVALKLLPDSFLTDPTRVARLQREAEMLAALNHPNVAQIYGLERSGGHTALVMELIEGQTLAERIAEGKLPPTEALNIAHQIAAALEAAHERGIVHRDLKPANIKLKPDGTVRVLDFGIAKALDARAQTGGSQHAALTNPAMTEAGFVLGTAAYMSPEQARGKPVDRRTDIWAFGCVLYEMLTGEAAFQGDDVTTTLAKVLERDVDMRKLPAGIPPTVRGTLELCLQKDPKKRLRDSGDVRLALEGNLVGASNLTSAPFWRRALPLAAAVVVSAVVAGAIVALFVRSPEPTQPVQQVALPVTRFTITPDPSTPLANLGGYDVMISPDGQRIAYFGQSPEDGSTALYVREINGLETRMVQGTEIGNQSGGVGTGNMNPFFSADSQSIGFLSPTRGVVRVALNGGPAMVITGAPAPAFLGASWGADESIVFSSGRALHRISAGGGASPERLTDEVPGAFVAAPVVLPGGRAVMYGVISEGVERVAVFDLERREEKIVIENGQNAFYSVTGHIVFARGTTIMAAPFSASELEVTGTAVAMVDNVRHPNSLTAADYALSATGTLVYVPADAQATAGSMVVWVDRTGKRIGPAVAEPIDNPRDPAISPDGTRLLLTTGPDGDGDLWSYDLRGRPPIRLAVTGDSRLGVWSPDGREVALTILAGSTPSVFTVQADGSTLVPRPLRAEDVSGGTRDWTSSGDLVLLRAPIPTASITAISATGDGPQRDIVVTDYAEFDPAVSPNGRWLAYTTNRTGAAEVWVQGYPEGVPVRVSSNGGFEPRWAANGRELYYLERNSIMAVAVETEGADFTFSTPERLFNGPYAMSVAWTAHSYDVAPDGRFRMIEIPGGSTATNIVVVQNWAEELRQRVPAGR
jgi:serine/threonine-protein kinase